MGARSTIRTALVALLTAGCLALWGGTATAAFPGENGPVLFEGFGDSPGVFSSPSITDAPVELSAGIGDPTNSSPVVSPDGNSIAFLADDNTSLNTIPVDGGTPSLVAGGTDQFFDLAWSPDGTEIAYYDIATQSYQARPAGGGASRTITSQIAPDTVLFAQFDFAWSSTDRLAATARGTDPDTSAIIRQGDIWTFGPAGESPVNLTDDQPADDRIHFDPAFSPDGSRIAYVLGVFDEPPETWDMNVDGSDKRKLADGASAPHYSPDGTKIAFTRGTVLWTMDADGSNEVEIGPRDQKFLTDWGPAPNPCANPDITGAGTISGTSADEVIAGSPGDDEISGGGGEDIICGYGGNDTIFQGASDGTEFHGGDGNDLIDASFGNDTVFGGSGDDVINAYGGNDTISGGPGDDTVEGGPGTDNVDGEDGSDILEGGPGIDNVAGGAGGDLILANRSVDPGAKTTAPELLDGGAGDDAIFGGAGVDVITGGEGEDSILAGGGNDLADGGAGDDDIAGDAGKDELSGGEGNDDVEGGGGKDTLLGGPGFDLLEGGGGKDTLKAGNPDPEDPDVAAGAIEILLGGGGGDKLIGGLADDRIKGGAGKDKLVGKAGFDTLVGGGGKDILLGGRADDTIKARDNKRDKKIDCGQGKDKGKADNKDPFLKSCERVRRG